MRHVDCLQTLDPQVVVVKTLTSLNEGPLYTATSRHNCCTRLCGRVPENRVIPCGPEGTKRLDIHTHVWKPHPQTKPKCQQIKPSDLCWRHSQEVEAPTSCVFPSCEIQNADSSSSCSQCFWCWLSTHPDVRTWIVGSFRKNRISPERNRSPSYYGPQ